MTTDAGGIGVLGEMLRTRSGVEPLPVIRRKAESVKESGFESGGTAREGDAPLCHTCRSATIARGPRLADEVVECHAFESRITFPVTFCTRYVHRQHPSVHEMEEIAWILRTDAKRSRIGFVQSKHVPWKERFTLDDE